MNPADEQEAKRYAAVLEFLPVLPEAKAELAKLVYGFFLVLQQLGHLALT
jgi:hypothetical protein